MWIEALVAVLHNEGHIVTVTMCLYCVMIETTAELKSNVKVKMDE